jgi:hypothetical protein
MVIKATFVNKATLLTMTTIATELNMLTTATKVVV